MVSAWRPAIHIRAGENVCIQAMTPTQASVALASRHVAAIASGEATTGLNTTRTGIAGASSSAAATHAALAATWRSAALAVQVLAAGDEPDFELAQGLHRVTFSRLRRRLGAGLTSPCCKHDR